MVRSKCEKNAKKKLSLIQPKVIVKSIWPKAGTGDTRLIRVGGVVAARMFIFLLVLFGV